MIFGLNDLLSEGFFFDEALGVADEDILELQLCGVQVGAAVTPLTA